jgi:tRNA nucleotidyltransferase (CCA-adding enzyme)
MISLPPKLTPIFDALYTHNITPIVVGGYVRDALLNIHSKDIDIELYNMHSLEELETILKPFGKLNLVGKSFGVIKLRLQELEIDFSPPRIESKHASGHKGFEIRYDFTLDFATAARRRDFTINAIGYNPQTKTLLDPYNGIKDLSAKRLMCVDPKTFIEDPLRPLRAVQFTARFTLTCDPQLLALCKEMIAQGAFEELPKERIFEEIKKLLLFSQKPSLGLRLLAQMGGSTLFAPPSKETWENALIRCDAIASIRMGNEKKDLPLMLAALLLDVLDPETVLKHISFHRSLFTATRAVIDYTRKWGILAFPPKPLLMGRDLIALGFSPSKDFKKMLDDAYEAQLNQEFSTENDAQQWLKIHSVTAL